MYVLADELGSLPSKTELAHIVVIGSESVTKAKPIADSAYGDLTPWKERIMITVGTINVWKAMI